MPPGCASCSRRAATFTPSPKRSPSSETTSPRLMPMRKRMRWSSGDLRLALRHAALGGDGAGDRIDHAAELAERAVAHELDDAAMVLRDQRLDEALAVVLEALERSRLVALDQARIADHIGRENGGKAAVDAGGGHCVTSNHSNAANFYACNRKRCKLGHFGRAFRHRSAICICSRITRLLRRRRAVLVSGTPARRSCAVFSSAARRGRPRRAGYGPPRCRSAGAA